MDDNNTVARADHDSAVATARSEATTAERGRFKAVMSSDAYAGREKSAHHMLLTTDMTAEAITGVLAGLPAAAASAAPAAAAAPEKPEGERSREANGGLVTVSAADKPEQPASAAGSWSKAVDKVNARIK